MRKSIQDTLTVELAGGMVEGLIDGLMASTTTEVEELVKACAARDRDDMRRALLKIVRFGKMRPQPGL